MSNAVSSIRLLTPSRKKLRKSFVGNFFRMVKLLEKCSLNVATSYLIKKRTVSNMALQCITPVSAVL